MVSVLSYSMVYRLTVLLLVAGAVVGCEETGGPNSNRADTLEPQDLAVMFDRFWRKDEARTGGRNVGLGLALVRAMADLLAIEVETQILPDRTFRVTLSRPVTG